MLALCRIAQRLNRCRYNGKAPDVVKTTAMVAASNQINDCDGFGFEMMEDDRNGLFSGNLSKQLSSPIEYSRFPDFNYHNLNSENIPLGEDWINQQVLANMQEKMGDEILSRVSSQDDKSKLVGFDGLELPQVLKTDFLRSADFPEMWAIQSSNVVDNFEMEESQDSRPYDLTACALIKHGMGGESHIDSLEFSTTQSNASFDGVDLKSGCSDQTKKQNEPKIGNGSRLKEIQTQQIQTSNNSSNKDESSSSNIIINNNISAGYGSNNNTNITMYNIPDHMMTKCPTGITTFSLMAGASSGTVLSAAALPRHNTTAKTKRSAPHKSERSRTLKEDDTCRPSTSLYTESLPTRDPFEIKAIATGLCQLFPSVYDRNVQLFDILAVKEAVTLPWPCNDPRGTITQISVQAKNPYPKHNGKKQYDSCTFMMKMMGDDEIKLRVWSSGRTQAYGCKSRDQLIEANTIAVDIIRVVDKMCKNSGDPLSFHSVVVDCQERYANIVEGCEEERRRVVAPR